MVSDPPHPCTTLRDCHVAITGGSSGIGLALALQSARAGARISLIARDPKKLAQARDAIRAAVSTVHAATFSADVAAESQLMEALRAAEQALGPIDVLITSAGVAHPGYFQEIPTAVHEHAMAVNYFGSLYAVKAILPGMRQRRRGAIILVSSGTGLCGFFGYTAYAPSKFALRGFAESLRAELRGSGVHLSIVYPPDTDTPQLAAENATKPVETKAITRGGGLWSADEVARAILSGMTRRRFSITPGMPLTALAWFHSLLAPVLRWSFDRTASRARAAADSAARNGKADRTP